MKKSILSSLIFFSLFSYLTQNATAQIAGDPNGDSVVNVADVVYEINYLFIDGPPPCEP